MRLSVAGGDGREANSRKLTPFEAVLVHEGGPIEGLPSAAGAYETASHADGDDSSASLTVIARVLCCSRTQTADCAIAPGDRRLPATDTQAAEPR